MGKGLTLTLYGRSALLRGYCDDCDQMAFILDDHFQCCDKRAKETTVKKLERQSDSSRRRISAYLKRKILVIQHYRCHYCGLDLSRIWYYRNKWGDFKEIVVHFDHFIPSSFTSIETLENLYAVCSPCNLYKGSKMFKTVGDLREYLQKKKDKKKFDGPYSASQFVDYCNK